MTEGPSDVTSSSSSTALLSTLFSGSFIPFAFRIGTILVALIAVAGGILYVKQDNLLVRYMLLTFEFMDRTVSKIFFLNLLVFTLMLGNIGILICFFLCITLNFAFRIFFYQIQYFPEIDGIPRHNKDNPRGYRSPAYHNIPFEEHRIGCSDGVQIHSWLLLGDFTSKDTTITAKTTTKKTSLPTIVYFHGNAGNVGLHIPSALQMLVQLERKVNILLVEYRGYGDSDNVPPSEAGLKLDAEAAIQFCLKHPKIDSNKILLFGRSLGGAVAFHLAQVCQRQQIPIAGIIVENTFLSISAMVDALMPKIIVLLKPLVLRMKWDSESIVPTLKNTPVLYLSGSKDELVPANHMTKLYQLSKQHSRSNARIHYVENGTHNDTWMKGGQPYWDAIRSFVSETLTGTATGPSADSKQQETQMDDRGAANMIPTTSANVLGMFKDALGPISTQTSSDDKQKDL
jgi:abhydrolase domain-containing protein 13